MKQIWRHRFFYVLELFLDFLQSRRPKRDRIRRRIRNWLSSLDRLHSIVQVRIENFPFVNKFSCRFQVTTDCSRWKKKSNRNISTFLRFTRASRKRNINIYNKSRNFRPKFESCGAKFVGFSVFDLRSRKSVFSWRVIDDNITFFERKASLKKIPKKFVKSKKFRVSVAVGCIDNDGNESSKNTSGEINRANLISSFVFVLTVNLNLVEPLFIEIERTVRVSNLSNSVLLDE